MRKLLLFFLSQRTLALARWDLHFVQVRLRNALTLKQKQIGKHAQARAARYLNLGSGPKGVASKEWINVDGWTDRNVHLAIDLNRPLPFADNYFAGIFSEHVFEH